MVQNCSFSKYFILNGNHIWPTLFVKVEKMLLKLLSNISRQRIELHLTAHKKSHLINYHAFGNIKITKR